MKVSIKKLPKSQIEVEGEVPAQEFDTHIKKAATAFVEQAEIPGFRKGKAPEDLVLQNVGEQKLLTKAAEETLKETWPRVLRDEHIEAIGPAKFHILKLARGNELRWRALVSILPRITLPDYKKIAHEKNTGKEKATLAVDDKEVEDTLLYIQKSRATKDGLPPLDDAFAKSIGSFSSLDSLRVSIRDGIKAEKESKAREEHRMKILHAIAEKTEIDVPDLMIGVEREKMAQELRESVEGMGLGWNDYLGHIKKTEEDLKKDWAADAERRVRSGLVLRAVALAEKIEPPEKDIAEKIEFFVAPYSKEERETLDRERIRDYAYGIVRNEKVFEFLESC